MPETITVATADGERIDVSGVARTDRTHDGTLELFDTDDVAIGEFPDARWTAVAEKVE